MAESPLVHGCQNPPARIPDPYNDALTTIDGLYFLKSEPAPGNFGNMQDEYRDSGPVWQGVGRHMYYLPSWEEAARAMERKLMGLEPYEAVPKVRRLGLKFWDTPFLAIHLADIDPCLLCARSHHQFLAIHLRRGGKSLPTSLQRAGLR